MLFRTDQEIWPEDGDVQDAGESRYFAVRYPCEYRTACSVV